MWPFSKNKRHTEPARLKKFLSAVHGGDWTDEKLVESLNNIFFALNELIQSDIEYYDCRRHTQRWLSISTRVGAFVFGTFGIVAPLLHNATQELKNYADYGYLSLAAATACLVFNHLFEATGGHIRYIMVQFDLGRLMVDFQLEWSQWLAKNHGAPPGGDQVEEAFALFRRVSNEAYQIIQAETKVWGKTVSDALAEYEKLLGSGAAKKHGNPRQPQPSNRVDQNHPAGGRSHD